MLYIFKKGKVVFENNFDNVADAKQWRDSNLDNGYSVEVSQYQPEPVSVDQRLIMDIHFGESIYKEFLLMNRKQNLGQGSPMPLGVSKNLRDELKYLRDLIMAGDIIQAKEELETMQASLLPTPVRNYFIARIDDYLKNFS